MMQAVAGKDGADKPWLGDVTMPARFSPTDIGADYVLGIARDEDLTPTVARYRLGTQRAGGAKKKLLAGAE